MTWKIGCEFCSTCEAFRRRKPVKLARIQKRKRPGVSGAFMPFRRASSKPVTRPGSELSQDSSGKSTVDEQGDAESDAVCVVSDPRLARLIEVWPALADDVKGELLTLAGLRPYDVDDFNDVGTDVIPVGDGGAQ